MRPKEIFSGVGVVMTTPFKENGEIDEKSLRKHTKFLIEGGLSTETGWLVPTGSTGECYVLSNEERERIWEIVIEEAKGKVPVVVGTNHTSTRDVISLAKAGKDLGADGLMNLIPFYHVPDKYAYVNHYQQISDAVDLPIQIYNNPFVSQFDVPIDYFDDLVEIENVVSVKDVTMNITKFEKLRHKFGKKSIITHGWGVPWEPAGSLMGSPGFISAIVNWWPEPVVKMYELAKEGKYIEAFRVRTEKLAAFSDILYTGLPSMGYAPLLCKYFEYKRGIIANESGRPPFDKLPESVIEEADGILKNTTW